jgi:hypothetical protein
MPFKAKDEFKAWRNIWQITHMGPFSGKKRVYTQKIIQLKNRNYYKT